MCVNCRFCFGSEIISKGKRNGLVKLNTLDIKTCRMQIKLWSAIRYDSTTYFLFASAIATSSLELRVWANTHTHARTHLLWIVIVDRGKLEKEFEDDKEAGKTRWFVIKSTLQVEWFWSISRSISHPMSDVLRSLPGVLPDISWPFIHAILG